ncbi:hypothetical protein BG005_008104 [Podila minutissima]|nr:hypothetical protein BG005_008104 [Podila minutissima]
MVFVGDRRTSTSSPYGRPISATLGSAGGAFRMMGRRKLTKFRYRILVLVYLAMGCIIPYYVMKHATDEQQHQEGMVEQRTGEASTGNTSTIVENGNDSSAPTVGYKRRAFFEDLVGNMAQRPLSGNEAWRPPHQPNAQQPPLRPPSSTHESPHALDSFLSPLIQQHRHHRVQHHKQLLETLDESFTLLRKQNKMTKVKTRIQYQKLINGAIRLASDFLQRKLPPELLFEQDQTRIPGTGINTPEKTAQFRALMDQALNQGRWVYEADRDYPDFGGATGWSKKKQNERDRDVTIDRAPFPEAGKYHWEPLLTSGGSDKNAMTGFSTIPWYTNRIQPEDFCRILGPRHIVLVGDLIHYQLHDSIMYNMFDTPQICYGDLACHQGVGHPLCPLPNDVRLKFVRNDLLSPTSSKITKVNETRTHHPVEMPWLKDLKLKDTVILGAPHHVMKDQKFRKRLVQTLLKIRLARPEALVIYRNNAIGHPDCPSKFNGFNADKDKDKKEPQPGSQQHDLQPPSPPKPGAWLSNRTTFGAPARPLEHDIPVEEILEYPLNWSHYDRQNQMAKVIVEAAGGIYWNVATMTNRRPDGHVGGHDCLSYRRPGPTDEWAVSLYNLFKTIERVEQATSPS